jgi:bifunctional UDP-N-acetylglucosamine pyrophosphorylase/glucosamine-1-phosphate N-acetyltransferase
LGTFTEVVRSRVGEGTQIPHLSYVGDAELGRDVNVGAGSITANWDGQMKHRTLVRDGTRLGSSTVLVAPVEVGEVAYTGAGSVITSDVPAGSLAVSRGRQRNVLGWVARRRPKSSNDSEASR